MSASVRRGKGRGKWQTVRSGEHSCCVLCFQCRFMVQVKAFIQQQQQPIRHMEMAVLCLHLKNLFCLNNIYSIQCFQQGIALQVIVIIWQLSPKDMKQCLYCMKDAITQKNDMTVKSSGNCMLITTFWRREEKNAYLDQRRNDFLVCPIISSLFPPSLYSPFPLPNLPAPWKT